MCGSFERQILWFRIVSKLFPVAAEEPFTKSDDIQEIVVKFDK